MARANRLGGTALAAAMAEHGVLWSRRLPYSPSCPSGVFEAIDLGASRWMGAWVSWCSAAPGRHAFLSLGDAALARAVQRRQPVIVDLLLASGLRSGVTSSVASKETGRRRPRRLESDGASCEAGVSRFHLGLRETSEVDGRRTMAILSPHECCPYHGASRSAGFTGNRCGSAREAQARAAIVHGHLEADAPAATCSSAPQRL